MIAQEPTPQNGMQQKLLPFSKRTLLWGGMGLVIAVGYAITHLPTPAELLGWAGLLGIGVWGGRRFWPLLAQSSVPVKPELLTVDRVKAAIAQTRIQIEQLVNESPHAKALERHYTAQLADIEQSLSRRTLEFQIVGTRAVCKTALRQRLMQQADGQSQWRFAGADELSTEALQTLTDLETLSQIDVVLFVLQGDLTQSEWATLQQLQAQHKRVLVLLNKLDQYLPAQAELLLAQIKQRVQGWVAAEDVMAIATCPLPLKVRRHHENGSYQETWETPQPQVQPLLNRMQTIAAQEMNQLIVQRAHQQTLVLQTTLQTALNQIRRDRAMPLLERYQWIAAGAAFANPLPSLDLVATAAITGKMIQDLAKVYQIQLSLNRATEIAGVLAKALIQMGLVEASSQFLSAALKGNAVTFAVGGTLQGVGAAYFTRMAGLSLMELFEGYQISEAGWQLDSLALGKIVQRVFGQHQRLDVFKDLVQQTLRRLRPKEETASVAV